MRPLTLLCLSTLAASDLASTSVVAAEVDARPPDRLTLSGNGARLTGEGLAESEDGTGGSLNYLHYVTPNALFGLGAEHQTLAESQWTFGSLRAAWSRGEPASKFTIFGEAHYGDGDENDRKFDYAVGVLGISQSLTSKFSVQLEGRQIDIDKTRGNLPKIGLTYLWSPRLMTSISYADSVGGNLGTELTTARLDHYGQYFNFMIGGATGRADPSVVSLQPGLTLPAQDLREGFLGIGKTFSRGEVQLLGDYLELADTEKVTVTLSFTAYLGSR